MRISETSQQGGSTGRTAAGAAMVLLLAACGRPGGPGGPMGLSASQREGIRDSVVQFVGEWKAAVVSLDTTRMGAFYATDSTFRWIEDGRVRYTSAGELLTAWRGTVPGVKAMELLLDETTVVPLAPGVAVVTTSFTQKVTDSAGRQGGFAGATSLVAIHTADGWRFLTGHTSSVGGPAPTTAVARP